jgi:Fe(3+) dicitrate transport protein
MKKWLLVLWCTVFSFLDILSQLPLQKDTTHYRYLPEITLVGKYSRSDLQQMPEIVGMSIYAGKKSSLLVLKNVEGNLVTNNMRQVMAKIPGIHIWESDGSGIQIGVAARGLSPNRSWEFNVRQNGYDIAADPYGYPEAYYNPQLQAVQRIEVVRGHGALQYGPHFGGMINYILRDGSEFNKPVQVETEQTVGSYGLYNHFTGVGGKTGKWNYYSFFDHRQATGYRANSRYFTYAGFGSVTYRPTSKLSITMEYMRSHIRSQQPGGLADAAIQANNRQSIRARNWMDIEWSTLALRSRYDISERSRMEGKIFGLLGDRNSIGFLPSGGINVVDAIDSVTNNYAPRNVNIDRYRNFGAEWKWIGEVNIGSVSSTLSGGLRFFQGNTNRLVVDGKGSTGTSYDVSVAGDIWTRDIDFNSRNYAAFAEQIFRLGKKWLVIPGIRYEWLEGRARGQNTIQNGVPVYLIPQSLSRGFLLAGIGAEYHVSDRAEWYANITQAYRPVQFADLSTPPGNDRIDPSLRDAEGFNADFGIRGQIHKRLYLDASIFYLFYGNRVGTLLEQDVNGSFYNWRTNIGSSRARGLELVLDYQAPIRKNQSDWKWGGFISYAYNDARYAQLQTTRIINNQLTKLDLRNNRVENAPEHTLRTGLNLQYRKIKLTGQYSYVSGVFSDANNTVTSTANGQNGWIPSYGVMDLTLSISVRRNWSFRTGINNLTDVVYFTRRAGGYPGPGALPADGRTGFITIAYKTM